MACRVAPSLRGWLTEVIHRHGARNLVELEPATDGWGVEVSAGSLEDALAFATALRARAERLPRGQGRQLAVEVRLIRPAWRDAALAGLEETTLPGPFRWVPRDTPPPAPERGALYYPRRLVFGDGRHPTTVLAAGAVVRRCRARGALSVLDVGTGTGVLALLAAATNPEVLAEGLDVDAEAVAAARLAAEWSGLSARVTFSETRLESLPSETFDVVVANLDLSALSPLLSDLGRVARGTLLLTGLLAGQVRSALEPLREWTLLGREESSPWVLLELGRTPRVTGEDTHAAPPGHGGGAPAGDGSPRRSWSLRPGP